MSVRPSFREACSTFLGSFSENGPRSTRRAAITAGIGLAISGSQAQDLATNTPRQEIQQSWNFHAQNTDIIQSHPGITSPYSGPNSLSSASEVKETASLEVIFGLRIWPGAEVHVDDLIWQVSASPMRTASTAFPTAKLSVSAPMSQTAPSPDSLSARPLAWAASRRQSRTTNFT